MTTHHQDIVKGYVVNDLRECSILLSKLYVETANTITVEQSDIIMDVKLMLRDLARSVAHDLG